MKKIFISYRYKDRPRFDLAREIAARLRFFSIEVILDQSSLLFGEDIKTFMTETIQTVDALVILLSDDYNQALLQKNAMGEGVRFEVNLALQERERRPTFKIIPILLDSSSPIPPFDRLKCATPNEIDQIITELGLVEHLNKSRILANRYRLDQLIETRGMARIFKSQDLVLDTAVEVYMVPGIQETGLQGERFRLFERVLKGRSQAFSPFLLNIRDSYVTSDGAYYLVTENFDGTDLSGLLYRGIFAHPFGALCIAYQVALGLYELHQYGVLHGGLSPRAIRLNKQRTRCKIVDFEFARPINSASQKFDGYPLITPPERFAGSSPSIQQDIYQIANLVFWLICGFPVVSRCMYTGGTSASSENKVTSEDPCLQDLIASELSKATSRITTLNNQSPDLEDAINRSKSADFLRDLLTPFLSCCLQPNPQSRPRNIGEVLGFLAKLDIPPAGRLLDRLGNEVSGALFPKYEI